MRNSQTEQSKKDGKLVPWGFDLVSEVIERGWIIWILRRMRESVENKVMIDGSFQVDGFDVQSSFPSRNSGQSFKQASNVSLNYWRS